MLIDLKPDYSNETVRHTAHSLSYSYMEETQPSFDCPSTTVDSNDYDTALEYLEYGSVY